ncbi:hypothetical protein NDU88_000134 [Pleurodeles waltl]|uniref:Uncharacterized protein n=1 Tax=Pleurodeles waltl TaxID=8319 RepID=A0AAV7KW81_PLEWA|nr:hypothetical protein NDU88_000134 [Pleurodeles waltl]
MPAGRCRPLKPGARYIQARYIQTRFIQARYIQARYIQARYIQARFIQARYIQARYIQACYGVGGAQALGFTRGLSGPRGFLGHQTNPKEVRWV